MREKTYRSDNKFYCAYLLSRPDLQFVGTEIVAHKTFFHFAPYDNVLLALDEYETQAAPPVQPRKLFTALSKFWRVINKEEEVEVYK